MLLQKVVNNCYGHLKIEIIFKMGLSRIFADICSLKTALSIYQSDAIQLYVEIKV